MPPFFDTALYHRPTPVICAKTGSGCRKPASRDELDSRHFHHPSCRSDKCCYCRGVSSKAKLVLAEISPWRLKLCDTEKDGACLFRAISIALYGSPDHHLDVRRRIVDFMEANYAFFEPSLQRIDPDIPERPRFAELQDYLDYMRLPDSWGSGQEINAAAHIYGYTFVNINPTFTAIFPPTEPALIPHLPPPFTHPAPFRPATPGYSHLWLALYDYHYQAVVRLEGPPPDFPIPDNWVIYDHHRRLRPTGVTVIRDTQELPPPGTPRRRVRTKKRVQPPTRERGEHGQTPRTARAQPQRRAGSPTPQSRGGNEAQPLGRGARRKRAPLRVRENEMEDDEVRPARNPRPPPDPALAKQRCARCQKRLLLNVEFDLHRGGKRKKTCQSCLEHAHAIRSERRFDRESSDEGEPVPDEPVPFVDIVEGRLEDPAISEEAQTS